MGCAIATIPTQRPCLLQDNSAESGYRTLLDQGTDPAIVAGWIREVEAERIAVQAKLRSATGRNTMTPQEITAIVTALGDIVKVLADAEPEDKIKIYARLGLQLTYDINANTIEAVAEPLHEEDNGSGTIESLVPKYGVRGAYWKLRTRNSMQIVQLIHLDYRAPREPSPTLRLPTSETLQRASHLQTIDVNHSIE